MIEPGYIQNGGDRWHISFSENGVMKVRLVEFQNQGTPPVYVHMPSANQVLISPFVAGPPDETVET